jgi:hypothetical protein
MTEGRGVIRSKNNISNIICGRFRFMERVGGGCWQVTKRIE